MFVSFLNHDWTDDQSVFASPAYLKSLARTNASVERYGWIGGSAQDKLRFVLPYILQRQKVFRFVQFQSATVCLDAAATADDEKVFLNSAATFLRKNRIDFIVQPTVNSLFRTYPDGAIQAPYGNYVLDLTLSEQELWNAMHIRHRQSVKAAAKSKVKVVQDNTHVDQAHRMIAESLARSGLAAYDRESFTALITGLGDKVRIFTAWQGDECQCCAVLPFSRYSASYIYGGRSAGADQGAHHLLHWEAIRYFKALGVSRYDFHGARLKPAPGSKQEGIGKFKARFGSRMETGYLWKLPLRPLRYLAYRKALGIRSWMQGHEVPADIIEQERAAA